MNDSNYKNIDIREDYLAEKDDLLDILLSDKTTNKNILWATDSYEYKGEQFSPCAQIKPELITGNHGKLIQPRAAKSAKEQLHRKHDKAEVFTPLSIVKQMNKACDPKRVTKYNWQKYVSLLKLEITCGEAPFIASRYDPVSKIQKVIPISKRVGFLDRKLRAVSKYSSTYEDWVKWSKIAMKSSYGYEWQGDNILIARENLLYTFIDFYRNRFKDKPQLSLQKEIAEIISWNIFQMDGLKYVVPMSCKPEKKLITGGLILFKKKEDRFEEIPCQGCVKKTAEGHNGTYVKIMDWEKDTSIRFVDMVKSKIARRK